MLNGGAIIQLKLFVRHPCLFSDFFEPLFGASYATLEGRNRGAVLVLCKGPSVHEERIPCYVTD